MLKWIAEWWRFLLFSVAIGVITAAAKRFLDNWIADSIIVFVTFTGGANMIFDLIGRRSWEQRLAEKDREILARDQELVARDQELVARDQELVARDQKLAAQERELAARDRELMAQSQEIFRLRQQIEEIQRRLDSQAQNQPEENS